MPDLHCLSKVQFKELDRLLLLCQLAHLDPCLVAALRTGGLLETPPPWHMTILIMVSKKFAGY